MKIIHLSVIALATLAMSACVVAPQQPMGYRMTSNVLPTYVNGQYVGMQPNVYATAPVAQPPATATNQVNVASAAPVNTPVPANNVASAATPAVNSAVSPPPTFVQAAPVYLQSPTPTVVYIQAPAPVYSYYPSYSSGYVDPFYGLGLGVGFGWGLGYYGNWGRRGGWNVRGGWHHH